MDFSNWKLNSAVQTVDNGQVTQATEQCRQSFLGKASQCIQRTMTAAALAGAVMAGAAQAGTVNEGVSAPSYDPYSEAAMLQASIAGTVQYHHLEDLRIKGERGDLVAATQYVDHMRDHLNAQHAGGLISDEDMKAYNEDFDRLLAQEEDAACLVAAAKATAARYDVTQRPIGAVLNGVGAVLTGGATIAIHAAQDASQHCIENDALRKGVGGAISLASMATGGAGTPSSLSNLSMANGLADAVFEHDRVLGDSIFASTAQGNAPSGSLDIDAMATSANEQASVTTKSTDHLKF